MENYCQVNLKYNTIQAYKNIIKNHIKPRIGMYRLSQITASTINELMTAIYVEKSFSKALRIIIVYIMLCLLPIIQDLEYLKYLD